MTIPSNVTSIAEAAFIDCGSLTAITVDVLNPSYSSVDGVLFNKSQTTLIQCPGGKAGRYAVPDGVTSIGYAAFYLCHMLTSVTIPTSVTSIDDWAFYYSSLRAVCFHGNAPSVGSQVFRNDVTVYCLPGATGWDPTFDDRPTGLWNSEVPCTYEVANSTITITLYTGSGGIVTIPSTINGLPVTSIGDHAFSDCTSLASVTIPSGVTNIGTWAFVGCTSLASVTIPNGVTSIEGGAFSGCTSLTSVTIPNSVTTLNEGSYSMWQYTFGRCTNLTSVNFQGNAPILDSHVFDGYVKATVYYLPGTMGWGSDVWGLSDSLMGTSYPVILTTAPSFGIQTNGFGFIISWATNLFVVAEASSNLANPVWSPVRTNTLTDGWSYFSDPDWANYPSRFYRIRSP